MSVAKVDCLRIEKEEWFDRTDFWGFLRQAFERNALATWWRPSKPFEDEMNDVFVTYDHGEGSDQIYLPEDIWEEICDLCRRHGMEYGLVWIVNC
jgi:hypothetical protein